MRTYQLNFSLLITLLLCILNLKSFASNTQIDGIWYNLYGDSAEVTCGYYGYTYYSGDVIIPNAVTFNDKTYRVTSIGEGAFYECNNLNSLTIPESVTRIGKYAFYDCSGLTSINIPMGVTRIEESVFEGCSSLTSITIHSFVKSIEEDAFNRCSGLTAVHISDMDAWFKISFTGWSSQPLYYAHHLFLNGEEINELVIPEGVTSIGNAAFSGCTALTSVTFHEGIMNIGFYAFCNCSGLTSISIPKNLTKIENDTFSGCSGLTSISIPESVTSIGNRAFADCNALTSITVPDGVTSIGENAFDGTAWFSNQPDGLIYAGKVAYKYKGTMPNNTNIVIKNGTQSVASSAFRGCGGLTSIIIPNSVTSIGNGAFHQCYGLTSITIPEMVTSIGKYTFYKCHGLTSVTIPKSLTSIEELAFYDCRGLNYVFITDLAAWCNISFFQDESQPLSYAHHLYLNGEEVKDLVIPESVTSINKYAFSGCTSLTSVTIQKDVTNIDWGAFEGCEHIIDFYCYPVDVPTTSAYAFRNHYIQNATLHVPAESLEDYSSTDPWYNFGSIVALTEDEVGVKEIQNDYLRVEYDDGLYDLSGRKLSKPQRGINIIRNNGGTAKKVVVK